MGAHERYGLLLYRTARCFEHAWEAGSTIAAASNNLREEEPLRMQRSYSALSSPWRELRQTCNLRDVHRASVVVRKITGV